MFSRVFAIASLVALAVAGSTGGTQQCNTGTLQCCDQVQQAATAQQLLDSFGLVDVLAGVTGLVGVNCNPISVLAAGNGAQCNTQPVCCTNDNMIGWVNMGCMATNVDA
ncbi:hydrophobin-3 precursor [Pisolithus marmoratus]|nr:hydrophobin-3 precursor [Pisolithus marmoratus]